MSHSILFLVTLVIVSGFIAYWGDLLGRRMGKRRLTLFGLRPKHTAIVVTTITGMIIAALTLAILLGVDKDLRTMLVRGRQIRLDNRQLTSRNAALKKHLAGLSAKQADLQSRTDAAVRDAADAEKKKQLAEAESKRLQAEVQERSTKLAALENEYQMTKGELASERRELQNTKAFVYVAGQVTGYLVKEYGEAVKKRVIVQSGEEIGRAVIRPSGVVKRDLTNLLNNTSRIMAAKRAAAGKNGRTILIEPRPGLKYEGDSIDAIARKISSYNGEVVAIVTALRNAVQGEQIPVAVLLYRNNLAFRKGQTIASATIDGSKSEAHVLNDLIGFFQRDVRRAAKDAHMIPVVVPDDPEGMYGTISGPQQLDEFMSVVNHIKDSNGPVPVQVVAQQDIRVADRMSLANLDFVVSKLPANASGAN